ncbi:MAG: glycosyltransferase family 39 protein, partial [Thermoplasmata archaeon]|nr:glycosyltransferase family 39 protein [Thermoplasmata archaeon]
MKANVLSGSHLLGPVWKEARRNRKTIMILTVLFILGLVIRTALYYQESVDSGEKLMSTDPFYHKRVIDYVVEEKQHLVRDPRLGYPSEPYNPHPPVFDWSIAIASLILGPFFGLGRTTLFMAQIWAPFWGAMTIVPVYFLTKEYFGRKAGLWAAFFLTIMPAHIDRSTFAFVDHDSFNLFFVVVTFFFMVKALRLERSGRYIESFRSPASILRGIRNYANANSISMGYAMMAAISMSTIALAWKGFSYVFAIVIVYYLAQLLINAFRHVDSTGLAITVMTILTLPLLLALPAYSSMHMIWSQWGLRPVIYVYASAWVLTLAFVPTRDVPWLVLLPVLSIAGTVGYFVVHQYNPQLAETLVSGAGYFVKSKRYSTIAEAQAPNLSRLIMSYGPVTFFFALIGILLAVMRFIRHWRIDELFISMWTLMSIVMALTATRFMFNAGPAFAVLQGWVAFLIIERTDFRAISRTIHGFSGSFWQGFRKGFSVKHAAVALFMVFMVVLPNAWYAFDASIPYEKKREIDNRIYDSMPEWLRPEKYDRDNTLWYTGAFGGSFPSEYWYTFFEWFSEQDGDIEVERRPAFLAWWDYGMECVQLGKHPTVADNFMNGHEMAGNFIAAQNESLAMSLLVTRILEFEIRHDDSPAAKALVERYLGEEDAATFFDALNHPADHIDHVNDHPEIYGRKEGLRQGNAKYTVCSQLVSKLNETSLTQMLLESEKLTGSRIRYFAVDSRMFPFSYYNTGIFYAPITLSDHYVSDYLKTLVQVGGQTVTPEEFERMLELDPDLTPDELVLSYTPAFFNTMFYRAYIGYSAEDVGGNASMGIPGLSGQMAGQPPMPGWMLRHFRLEYRTAYWNPYEEDEVRAHKDAWKIVPFDVAIEWSEDENVTGTADFQTGLVQGVMMLKYYPGAIVNGNVATVGGVPVIGARVTVLDEYGIPHDIATTDKDGRYRVIAPSGENVTLTVSRGGKLNGITQTFEEVLESVNFTITEDQAERREVDDDGDGHPDYIIDRDITVDSTTVNGTAFWDTDQNERFDDDEVPLGNAVVELNGTNVILLTTADNGTFNSSDALDGNYDVFLLRDGARYDLDRSIKVDGGEPVVDQEIWVQGFRLSGTLVDEAGEGVSGASLALLDTESGAAYDVRIKKDGKFEIGDLLPGKDGDAEITISLSVPGKVPIERMIRARMGKSAKLDLTLRNSSYISGTAFLDDGVGSPDGKAPGVLVVADGADTYEATTEANGSFNLTLPAGRYALTARYVDGDDLLTAMVWADAPDDDVSLVLGPTYTVGGQLYVDRNDNGEYDASTDKPAQSAEVEIVGSRGWRGEATMGGKFSAQLPAGDYYMTVRHSDTGDNETYLAGEWFSVERDLPMDVAVEPTETVKGSVFWDRNLDGKAQPGEYVDGIPLIFSGEHEFKTITGAVRTHLSHLYSDGFYFNTFSVSTGSNGTFEVDLI